MDSFAYSVRIEQLYSTGECLIMPNAYLSDHGFYFTGVAFTWAPNTGAAIYANDEGVMLLDLPIKQMSRENLRYPIATELCQEIMDTVKKQMQWEFTRMDAVHDIVRAEFVLYDYDGQKKVFSASIDGAKATQLEKLLIASREWGTGVGMSKSSIVGPQLHLTRADGHVIVAGLDLNADHIVLEPWFSYDYGPADEQDGTRELLKIFGWDDWPDPVRAFLDDLPWDAYPWNLW